MKRSMIAVVSMAAVMFIAGATQAFGPTIVFSEDFNNGNTAGWTTYYTEPTHGTQTSGVVNGVYQVSRTGAGGSGGGGGIWRQLDILIDSNTQIKFDVRPIYSSVANDTGYWNESYPAIVCLVMDTPLGQRDLRFAYNNDSSIKPDVSMTWPLSTSYQVSHSNVSGWQLAQTYTITDYFPTATRLTQIVLKGEGWDYTGEFDNIQIVPEPATLSLLALGGLAVLRRRRAR